MGIFESIEKLITEHGSAQILRERIQLVKDQHDKLERDLAAANKRMAALEQENASLQAKLDGSRGRSTHRRTLPLASTANERLPAERESVLAFMTGRSDNTEATDVSAGLGIGVEHAKFHLEALKGEGLLHSTHYAGLPSMGIGAADSYELSQPGREYLYTHGLL
jgi:hypothetical protein